MVGSGVMHVEVDHSYRNTLHFLRRRRKMDEEEEQKNNDGEEKEEGGGREWTSERTS